MLYKIKNIPQVYLHKIASFLSIRFNSSITIEATLSLTLAIFATTFMLGPMFIINSTIDIIDKTDNASRLLSYYDIIMEKYVRDKNNIEHINIDLLNDTAFEFLNKINIPASIIGNFGLLSAIDSENIRLQSAPDLKNILYDNNHMINYDISFIGKHPLNIWNLKNPEFRIINSRRSFVGVKGNRWNDKEENEQIVYNVSDDSNVYHLSLNCTYLKKVINKCHVSEISSLSNYNGSKYTACGTCFKNNLNQDDYLVYFTKYGIHFHIKNNCSRLEPLIIRQISLNKALEKGLRVCTKCDSNNNE